MASLWRLHIRPKGGDADARLSTAFCLQQGIVGMGWSVPDSDVEKSTDFEWYKAEAEKQYGEDHSWYSVWTFAEAKIGDLLWFRDTEGRYYLAELAGPWEYRYSGDHVPADIVNFRKARIVSAGLADAVPGKVIGCFRPPRTFQGITAPGMLAFAQNLMGKPITENDEGRFVRLLERRRYRKHRVRLSAARGMVRAPRHAPGRYAALRVCVGQSDDG